MFKNKKKINENKSKEHLMDEVENFLNLHKISGILDIPKVGTFSYFQNDGGRLLVLDRAKIELGVIDNIIENEIKFRVKEEHKSIHSKHVPSPTYTR